MEKMSNEQRSLAKRAYPEYRGRKFKVTTRRTYFMQDYWSEGSRNYVVAVNLETGEIGQPATFAQSPMNRAAHAEFVIPAGFALIEHSIFCGHDCGLTFILPSQGEITVRPNPVLTAETCGRPSWELA